MVALLVRLVVATDCSRLDTDTRRNSFVEMSGTMVGSSTHAADMSVLEDKLNTSMLVVMIQVFVSMPQTKVRSHPREEVLETSAEPLG